MDNNNNNDNDKLKLFLQSDELRIKLLFDFLLLNIDDNINHKDNQDDNEEDDEDEDGHHNHHSTDDTKFEKIFDRLKLIMSNDDNKVNLLDTSLNLLNRTIYSIFKRSEIIISNESSTTSDYNLYQDSTTNLQRLLSSNLRLLGLLLSYKSILNKFIINTNNNNNNNNRDELIKLITSKLLNSNNALIKNNSILLIKEIIDTSNKEQIIKLVFNNENDNSSFKIIESIFSSFNYPSTFVTRSSTELLSNLFIIQIDSINSIIINQIKSLLLSNSTSNDIKLCILDFTINLLFYCSKNNQDDNNVYKLINYIKSSDLICIMCSLILDRNRLIRSRSIEMLNVIIENKIKDYLNDNILNFFKSIIQKLILPFSNQTINKESIITVIDLIGVLDNSFLFPITSITSNTSTTTSTTTTTPTPPVLSLFNNIEPIIQLLINRDLRIIDDTSIYQFHLFQCTKEILKRSKSNTSIELFNKDWIKYILECCILKSKYSPSMSNKTHKEAFECLSLFNLNQWINIELIGSSTTTTNNNNNNFIFNQIQPTTTTASNTIYLFLKNLVKLNKPLLKESFNTLIQFISNYKLIKEIYNQFDKEFIDCISSLLYSPHSDIRDITLCFLKRIFNNNDNDNNDNSNYQLFKELVFNNNGNGNGDTYGLNKLLELILKRLTDSDNYVRSSTLELIGLISIDRNGWNSLLNIKEPLFKQLEQLHLITKETPILNINDDICNNNQINLSNYTELLEKEIKERVNEQQQHQDSISNQKNHLFYNDNISITSEQQQQQQEQEHHNNNKNDNLDWEWEDEEFKELLKRNQEEPITFMNDNDDDYGYISNQSDISLPTDTIKLFNYKFPYSIILFLNDEDSYPRISTIELLILWINIPHCFSFLFNIINDDKENEKYSINNCISNLMSDNGYWEVKSKLIDLFSTILKKSNQQDQSSPFKLIIKLNVIQLLINNIKNNLEDRIIKTKSIDCLNEIINQLQQQQQQQSNQHNNQEEQEEFKKLLLFINNNINLDLEIENCSLKNDFTEQDEEDLILYNETYNNNNNNNNENDNENNKLDCY